MSARNLSRVALFAALMAICSWISIPAPVPFTLQTFAVFLAPGLLGGKMGTIAVGTYLLLGAVGLPVFAGFSGGIGALLGATGGYLLGFTSPIPVMTPFNIIGEIATPVSMTFRHFGNIASGSVITALIYGGLSALSGLVLGLFPGAAGELLSQIPVFGLGLPAILSLYFDFFSSVLQAFIFCMLTMMYIGGAAETGD